jgi:hypothetical protein
MEADDDDRFQALQDAVDLLNTKIKKLEETFKAEIAASASSQESARKAVEKKLLFVIGDLEVAHEALRFELTQDKFVLEDELRALKRRLEKLEDEDEDRPTKRARRGNA